MSDDASFLVEDFIHSIAAQLDRVQDALRLKAINRPLTYALKDFSLDLHVFADMSDEGHVRFRTAGPNEAGASTVRIAFTTITRSMIEENTVSLQATAGPGLDELGLDPAERRRLEQLGVRNASQLNRLQRSAGAGTIQRLAHMPASRLRAALDRGRPTVDKVSIVPGRPGGTPPVRGPAKPDTPVVAPPVRPPQPAGPLPAGPLPAGPLPAPPARPVVTPPPSLPPRPGRSPEAGPLPVTQPSPGAGSRPIGAPPAARLRLEGRNLLGAGVPTARINEWSVPLAIADEDAIELDLPASAGVLTLELPDGETHEIPFDVSTPEGVDDPWGHA